MPKLKLKHGRNHPNKTQADFMKGRGRSLPRGSKASGNHSNKMTMASSVVHPARINSSPDVPRSHRRKGKKSLDRRFKFNLPEGLPRPRDAMNLTPMSGEVSVMPAPSMPEADVMTMQTPRLSEALMPKLQQLLPLVDGKRRIHLYTARLELSPDDFSSTRLRTSGMLLLNVAM